MQIRTYISLLLLGCWVFMAQAQQFTLHSDSEVKVEGTSNIKDWTATATKLSGTLTVDKVFLKKGPGKGKGILEASLQVPVAALDGGRGETMNDKIKKAFTATENPEIIYRLKSSEVFDPTNDKTFKLRTTGTLTMAGQTQTVSLDVSGVQASNGQLVFEGTHRINMKEFGMEPPTAMFGQIEAGEWVTVHFTLVFQPISSRKGN